jgi:hypothetical protein
MRKHISDPLRLQVAIRARFCCEYCLVHERFLATTFHVDHARSIKHGGKTEFINLVFACAHDNQNKGSNVATFIDENSNEIVRLFNPRIDLWDEHFFLIGGEILSKTTIGAATIRILDMNQPERVLFRTALANAGFYPENRV